MEYFHNLSIAVIDFKQPNILYKFNEKTGKFIYKFIDIGGM